MSCRINRKNKRIPRFQTKDEEAYNWLNYFRVMELTKITQAERGSSSEERVMKILKDLSYEVERASRHQDHQGIDVVVKTTKGTAYIQVKSSDVGAQKFLKENIKRIQESVHAPWIPVVIVNSEKSDELLKQNLIEGITNYYKYN